MDFALKILIQNFWNSLFLLELDHTYASRWTVVIGCDHCAINQIAHSCNLMRTWAIMGRSISENFQEGNWNYNWKNWYPTRAGTRSDSPSLIWQLVIAIGSARCWSQSKLIASVRLISFAFMCYNWSHLIATAQWTRWCARALTPISRPHFKSFQFLSVDYILNSEWFFFFFFLFQIIYTYNFFHLSSNLKCFWIFLMFLQWDNRNVSNLKKKKLFSVWFLQIVFKFLEVFPICL